MLWVPVFQSRSEASCLEEGTSQVKAQDELCTDGFAENAHACPPPGVPDAPLGHSETESSIRSSHLSPKCCHQTHTCNHTGWVSKGVLCFQGLAAKLGGKEQGKMLIGSNYRVLIYVGHYSRLLLVLIQLEIGNVAIPILQIKTLRQGRVGRCWKSPSWYEAELG